MKNQREGPLASPAASDFDALSGTNKAQREKWWKAFWRCVAKDSNAAEILLRWRSAGCDPRNITATIHRYVSGWARLLDEPRRTRGKKVKRILTATVRPLRDLEAFYRSCNQAAAADRIAKEANQVNELLSRSRRAFSTKRLGISRSWTDLAMIEGFVFEATKLRPTPSELVCLIRIGREVSGQQPNPWEKNPTNIRKGLILFKKNNPLQRWLWTNPSEPP